MITEGFKAAHWHMQAEAVSCDEFVKSILNKQVKRVYCRYNGGALDDLKGGE